LRYLRRALDSRAAREYFRHTLPETPCRDRIRLTSRAAKRRSVVRTFVDGSPGSAAAALLGMDGGPLSDETRSPHTES
jgi:hypothetical protein